MRASQLLALLIPLVACEGPNPPACEAFEVRFRSLPCVAGLESGVDCQAFGDHPCDLTAYFSCLGDNQTCQGDTLVSDVAACAELAACP